MKRVHILVLPLFIVALALYVAASTTGAMIFGGAGVGLELTAWIIAGASRPPPIGR